MSRTAYVLEEADNYEKNYQYDTTGWSFSLPTNEEEAAKAKAVNIFTAESDEILEVVSFYTTDANTSYTVSVYTSVSEGAPETGTAYRAVQSGTEPYAGYHTIELDTSIPLKAGEKFSIVVELENPTYESPLAVEWGPMQSEDFVPQSAGRAMSLPTTRGRTLQAKHWDSISPTFASKASPTRCRNPGQRFPPSFFPRRKARWRPGRK